jgi:hypothetical protein
VRPRLTGGALGHAVYTLPAFASQKECDALIAEAAKLKESYTWSDERHPQPGRTRLPLACEMKDTLLRRLLALVEAQMPSLAAAAFGREKGLAEMPVYFATGEPAVNIYTAGGQFKPHTDKMGLTIVIPLSPPGAFEGGGTAFWAEGHLAPSKPGCELEDSNVNDERNWRPHAHAVSAPAGTAVLFGGDVTHAGLPVTSGTRHLFVMSFALRTAEQIAAEEAAALAEARPEDIDLSELVDFGDDFDFGGVEFE